MHTGLIEDKMERNNQRASYITGLFLEKNNDNKISHCIPVYMVFIYNMMKVLYDRISHHQKP